jgi:FemAB family protein
MNIYPSNPQFKEKSYHLAVKSGWHSPLYTESSLKYFQQRPKDDGRKLQDISFILEWENEQVAVFIGAIVESDNVTDLLSYEVPCYMVEDKERITAKATKYFLREVDSILSQINGKFLYRDFLIEGNISSLSTHLLKKGAIERPIFSKVIDLTKDKALLWRSVRKSYSSLINNGLRDLCPEIITSKEVSWSHFEKFRELHIREAGRETRSVESWRRQFEAVQADEAFLVLGEFDGEMVTAGYFSYSETNCFYGSSASRRDLFDKPLFHAIMWTAILHAKELGCRWFEVGEQHYLNHQVDKPPTKKELGISDFKAGFGGEIKINLDIEYNFSQNKT